MYETWVMHLTSLILDEENGIGREHSKRKDTSKACKPEKGIILVQLFTQELQ